MIQLNITMTGKGYAKGSRWQQMHHERLDFSDMAEARKYLRDRYGKCKRVPMYADKKSGETIKIGYVYGFRNSDVSHYPVDKWIQQDWVEFLEVKSIQL